MSCHKTAIGTLGERGMNRQLEITDCDLKIGYDGPRLSEFEGEFLP